MMPGLALFTFVMLVLAFLWLVFPWLIGLAMFALIVLAIVVPLWDMKLIQRAYNWMKIP